MLDAFELAVDSMFEQRGSTVPASDFYALKLKFGKVTEPPLPSRFSDPSLAEEHWKPKISELLDTCDTMRTIYGDYIYGPRYDNKAYVDDEGVVLRAGLRNRGFHFKWEEIFDFTD